MAKKSKGPWFWKARKQWVVNINGTRHYLGSDRSEAYQEWHRLSTQETPRISGKHVVAVLDSFLTWCQTDRPDSYDWYSTRINEFANTCPTLRMSALKPEHVRNWVKTKKSDGHKRGCIVAVSRALNWAVREGMIETNPLRFMEKPSPGRREVFLTPDEFSKLLSHATDECFKDLLTFCWETGCRPQEVFRLEARHVEENRCVFPEKESKGKKKKRVIYLTPVASEILRRLVAAHPEGRLFRNARGKPWGGNNVACRFGRLQKRLAGKIVLKKSEVETLATELKKRRPMKVVGGTEFRKTEADLRREARKKLRAKRATGPKYALYHLRHSYCQRALKNGVDPITLAELMGHSSAAMIMRIYQHLAQDKSHMVEAAARAAK
jgi:integrase